MLDLDLTRGYLHTQLFVKSRRYTSTEVTQYRLIDFIAHVTAMLLGLFWIFKLFYLYVLPIAFIAELDVIEQIYRISEH